jgi:signal transduction histidine kinase
LDSERVVMQVRDVTNTVNSLKERDRQEELLHRANNKLNRQNEKLLNFSYIVSHNIRSHSSNIAGFSQIISDGVKDPAMCKFVEGLQKASESLDMTLRHLNELINIQSGKDVKLAVIPLFPALQNTVATLAYDINRYDVGLDIQVPLDFCVDAYDVYLDSILLNLFSNAIKYRQEHLPLTISVKCGFSEGYKWFSITDNGLGIDLDLFGSKLFGMFQTFHKQPQSRGVGLFILKNQVEALQGKVEVESEVGRGTTFKIYLPEL